MKEFENILSPLCAWFIAQFLKTLISSIKNRKLDLDRIFGDGGMPSSHSAFVTALAVSCALCFGLASSQFAISAVLALVVMHDASGIRLESGKQARGINEIREFLQNMSFKSKDEQLEELLGHTPLQVFFGALLGGLVATAVHFI